MVSSSNHPISSDSTSSQSPETMEGEHGTMASTLASTSASTSSSASHEMETTPDRASHYSLHTSSQASSKDALKQNVHVRQNFGKDRGGYIPPATNEWAPPEPSGLQNIPVPVTPEARTSPDNDLPFDVLNHMTERSDRTPPSPTMISRASPTMISRASPTTISRASPTMISRASPTMNSIATEDTHLSPSSTRGFDSVWESSPEGEGKGLRFPMGPPKFNDPSALDEDDTVMDPFEGSPSRSASDNSRPGPTVIPFWEDDAPHDEDDSIFNFEEETREVEPQFPDAEQEPVKITHKIRRRMRQHVRQQLEEDETDEPDDTSLDEMPPANLHERTQQAWKSRRQKNSSLRSKEDPKRNKAANVSFGASDTVQYFEPDVHEDDEETYNSFDERSLNSDYTKTLESEVEDMIKDILFIGNCKASQPGRRKLKFKPELKRKVRRKQMQTMSPDMDDENVGRACKFRETADSRKKKTESTGDNSRTDKEEVTPRTAHTIQEDANGGGSKVRSKESSKNNSEKGDDPLLAVWGFMEGSVSAVTAALGLSAEEKQAAAGHGRATERSRGQTTDISDGTCTDPLVPFETCTGKITQEPESERGISGYFDRAQDFWFGPIGESAEVSCDLHDGVFFVAAVSNLTSPPVFPQSFGNSGSQSKDSMEDDAVDGAVDDGKRLPFSLSDMDKDPRLAGLARNAAQSLHQIQGVEFDESAEIDVYSDVKISFVELKLPLGCKYYETFPVFFSKIDFIVLTVLL
jgi:hypothetical protein